MDYRKEKALELLRRFYGYSSFRPGQYEIIESVLSGRDAVALMPTGGGKSICYQLPALMMEGCALVVSPLIALMDDQTEGLIANGIPAASIHSVSTETNNREIIEAAFHGRIKLLYTSPERLLSDLDSWVSQLSISLIAVDEAHCISQWGHDFRPVYTRLSILKERFSDVPVLALTATADRLTRDDITDRLGLRNPLRWIGSFDRPNISINVMDNVPKRTRLSQIQQLVRKYPGDSGIVYTLSRKGAEEMAESLVRLGIRAVVYHAGLPSSARVAAQRAFTNGDVQVVCATVAFGMGIDKSNIRWVVHNNMPGNIESYYQEIGRAGRDGLPAETILFHSYQDVVMREKLLEDSGRPAIDAEKLKAMKAYAEASVCRRRILLSYFGEEVLDDCGNCDVCRNPRERFDGTVLAQKAGSAVLRLGEQIGLFTLVEVLRGSSRAEIVQKGYHTIPTFGAGRDLSPREWTSYIGQMIQLGLFIVAFEDSNRLRVTPYGMKVIRGQAQIELTRFVPFEILKKSRRNVSPGAASDHTTDLFEKLRTVRRELAGKNNVAIEAIFNDATLLEIARRKPSTIKEFMNVDGVGVLKCVVYGRKFVGAVRKFLGMSAALPNGTTYFETLLLHNARYPLAEIARIKDITEETVLSHIARLITEGQITSYEGYVSDAEYWQIAALLAARDSEGLRSFSSGKVAVVRAAEGVSIGPAKD